MVALDTRNMGGPRPALTPKDSVWCTHNAVQIRDTWWQRVSSEKHAIRFWPDYYHHMFVAWQYHNDSLYGRGWINTGDQMHVDCDA